LNNKTGLIVAGIFVMLSVWFYFTPHRVVDNMRTAAESKNAAMLSRYVDYPALKESLKVSVNSTLSPNKPDKSSGDPFAVLGAALTGAFIESMIDKLITPEGLSMMLQGDVLQLNADGKNNKSPAADFETSMGYKSFGSFVVTITRKASKESPVALIFSREGLFSWKLTGVRLPV